jgi:hypothetical protein
MARQDGDHVNDAHLRLRAMADAGPPPRLGRSHRAAMRSRALSGDGLDPWP